jgi:2,4-dienoyl-CoA reductase-like NADH-dependent reductase (Old Yellow Enzyme family)
MIMRSNGCRKSLIVHRVMRQIDLLSGGTRPNHHRGHPDFSHGLGIHLPKHVSAWAKIVDAVHNIGGHIFLQLWHVGTIFHTSLLLDNQAPVAPSAVSARARTVTENGFEDVSTPRPHAR